MKELLLSQCCGAMPTEMMACSDCREIDTAFQVIPLDANDMPSTVQFTDGSEMEIDADGMLREPLAVAIAGGVCMVLGFVAFAVLLIVVGGLD